MASTMERRAHIRSMLDLTDAADALTVYYGLYYPAEKATIHLLREQEEVAGFLVICRTAVTLFAPLVVMRSRSADTTLRLLREFLCPGQEYFFAIEELDLDPLRTTCRTWEESHERIYTVDPAQFVPHEHPCLRRRDRSDGRMRFEVVLEGQPASYAGTNWESPYFGEIGVVTDSAHRRRGLGKAVVSACTDVLLARGIAPLYMADEENVASRRLCEALGYRDQGHREFACRGMLR
jgi:RimJ/RimL family protein N-acetyltransferase